jgi:hypothetical protein
MNENLLYDNQTLILFVDDHLENCQDVNKLTSELQASIFIFQYKSKESCNLENIISLLINNKFSELERMVYKTS